MEKKQRDAITDAATQDSNVMDQRVWAEKPYFFIIHCSTTAYLVLSLSIFFL